MPTPEHPRFCSSFGPSSGAHESEPAAGGREELTVTAPLSRLEGRPLLSLPRGSDRHLSPEEWMPMAPRKTAESLDHSVLHTEPVPEHVRSSTRSHSAVSSSPPCVLVVAPPGDGGAGTDVRHPVIPGLEIRMASPCASPVNSQCGQDSADSASGGAAPRRLRMEAVEDSADRAAGASSPTACSRMEVARANLGTSCDEAARSCFYLRYVVVDTFFAGGSLGLMLTGTVIEGFSELDAKKAGWCIGDQIVEVNGFAVASFDEFMLRFQEEKRGGIKCIRFGVLRREDDEEENSVDTETAGDSLGHFLTRVDLPELASRVQRRDRMSSSVPSSASTDASLGSVDPEIISNPYVQALRKRRVELERSESWIEGGSLPAQLATKRQGALSMLTGVDSRRKAPTRSCAWLPFCSNGAIEIVPTPRIEGLGVTEFYTVQDDVVTTGTSRLDSDDEQDGVLGWSSHPEVCHYIPRS